MEKGLNPKGYLVCKYAFKRISGQPPLPIKDEDEDTKEADSSAAEQPSSPINFNVPDEDTKSPLAGSSANL
ncbi:hypothetical protein DXG03_007050 [Asterophora parasitica]|uniref:Uncharacterized protein n=1 Tax=Asterophora parasitica TaxID=117018 RepID=A0A9P7KHR5_9AGAR|nr:hypothetical protein DXG03_007050 [Asterophora parasitica]